MSVSAGKGTIDAGLIITSKQDFQDMRHVAREVADVVGVDDNASLIRKFGQFLIDLAIEFVRDFFLVMKWNIVIKSILAKDITGGVIFEI